MYNIVLLLLLLFNIFSGCVAQKPAPVEHKNIIGKNIYDSTARVSFNDTTDTINNTQGDYFNNNQQPYDNNIITTETKIKEDKVLKAKKHEKYDFNQESDFFINPVEGYIITKFGQNTKDGISKGIDIGTQKDAMVLSIADGVVAYVGFKEYFGKIVIVKLDNKNDTYVAYSNLNNISVTKGEHLKQGDTIAEVLLKNNIPTLHLAIKEGDIPVDPMKYLHY